MLRNKLSFILASSLCLSFVACDGDDGDDSGAGATESGTTDATTTDTPTTGTPTTDTPTTGTPTTDGETTDTPDTDTAGTDTAGDSSTTDGPGDPCDDVVCDAGQVCAGGICVDDAGTDTEGGTDTGGETAGTCEPGACGECEDPNECVACTQMPAGECVAVNAACNMNADCNAILVCANACLDQACVDECLAASPDGADDYNALTDCILGLCL